MRNRLAIVGLLCVGLSLVASSNSARADFTYSPPPASISLTQTDWGPGKFPVGVNPMEVERFNPANFGGATLTRVDLKLDYRFENTLSIQFFNITTITVNATGKIDLFMPDGTTKAVPTGTFLNTASMTSNPSTMLMKFVVPQPPTTGSSSATYTDAATLAQFTGTTKIGFPAVASATSDFKSLSGNGFGSSLTLASATVSVIYYFVPEPSSLVLAGLGTMGLLVVAARRRGLAMTGEAIS